MIGITDCIYDEIGKHSFDLRTIDQHGWKLHRRVDLERQSLRFNLWSQLLTGYIDEVFSSDGLKLRFGFSGFNSRKIEQVASQFV